MKHGRNALLFLFLLYTCLPAYAQTQGAALRWAARLGGGGGDRGTCMVTDLQGNVYATGSYSGVVDFDPGLGSVSFNSSIDGGSYLTKFSSEGALLWARAIGAGTNNGCSVFTVVLDSAGNLYVYGLFSRTVDFDPGPGEVNLVSGGGGSWDVFIAKYTSSGDLVWVKGLGGLDNETISCMSYDQKNGLYIIGKYTRDMDFDPGPKKFLLSTPMDGLYYYENVFISSFDTSGNFKWAVRIKSRSCNVFGIIADESGNAYVTGNFYEEVDFDPGPGRFYMTSTGTGVGITDGFVLKLNASGKFAWAKKMPNSVYAAAIDRSSHLYLTGILAKRSDLDPGIDSFMVDWKGGSDIYIVKLDSAGQFNWGKTIGGKKQDEAYAIGTDHAANLYLTGSFNGKTDFDPGPDSAILYAGGYDVFLASLDSAGNFRAATAFRNGYGAAVVGDGEAMYATGICSDSVDFDPSQGLVKPIPHGGDDIFIVKYTSCKTTKSSIWVNACKEYLSPSGRYLWDSSGTYIDTLVNAGGCDSLITIALVVSNGSDSAVIYPQACSSYRSPSERYTWNVSGTYIDTLNGSSGCDSIITIHLKINATFDTVYMAVCSSFFSPSGKYVWAMPGIYADTIPNSKGCDSVLTIYLLISAKATLIKPLACHNFISPSGRYIWTTTGIYADTVPGAECDSIIIVDLTINGPDTGVTVNGAMLTADADSAAYQWIDCKDLLPLPDDTGRTFTASVSGDYAVLISKNGCIDTSACYTLEIATGIAEMIDDGVSIFPNPANGSVIIRLSRPSPGTRITIFSMAGETVYNTIVNTGHIFEISADLLPGFYMVQVLTKEGTIMRRKVISR